MAAMCTQEAKSQLLKIMEELKIPPLGRQVRPSSLAKFDASKFRHMPETQAEHKKRLADEALKMADFDSVPQPMISRRLKKKKSKMERNQWKWGKGGWGDFKMKEKTQDDKNNLEILNMRSTLDPQRHYKHSDLKAPKFFQIGSIVDNPLNAFDRLPKKKRKKTLLDELMADEDFRRKTKKQYLQVIAEKGRPRGKAPKRIKKKKMK